VGVVDDHAVVIRGIAADLTEAAGIEVVATARTTPELLTSGVSLDVVVLDLDLRDGSRPGDNVTALREAGARVLLFSAYEDGALLTDGVRAGAHGYLSKARDIEDLATAIREIMADEEAISAEMLIALSAVARNRPDLSPRQEEVLVRYTSTDAKLPTVARQLGMRPETLKTHLRRIKEKYAAVDRPISTRLELYRRAVEDGYLATEQTGSPS
jgi:DNA-binding NarL/FixJ family response regulator